MQRSKRVEHGVLAITLSILLPMILFGYIFYSTTVDQTLNQAETRLRDDSKAYALLLLERLKTHAAISAENPLASPRSSLFFESSTNNFVIDTNTYVSIDDLLWDLDTSAARRCVIIDSGFLQCSGAAYPDEDTVQREWALFLNGNFDTATTLTVQSTITKTQALEAFELVARVYPLLAVLTSLLVGWIAYRLLLKRLEPLGKLQTATAAVTAGDYSIRVDVRTGDEFETLGRAFNQMFETLEQSFEQLGHLAEIDRMILSATGPDDIIRATLEVAYKEIGNSLEIILWHETPKPLVVHYCYDGIVLNKETISVEEFAAISDWHDLSHMRGVVAHLCGIESALFFTIDVDETLTGFLITHQDDSLERHPSIAGFVDRLAVGLINVWRSEDLYQQAHYDRLTGLLNRPAFEDRLVYALAQSKRRGKHGALLFMDLDRFKQVNDTEGHKAGDRLLVEIARRLMKTLREEDTLSRFGGDEFGFLIPTFNDHRELVTVCNRIVEKLRRPIVVDRLEHVISVSIGVAVFPTDAASAEELLMMADAAMYRAKDAGGCKTSFYDKGLNETVQQRVVLESRLRKALKDHDLRLYFQPKMDLSSGQITGAEGLMRWHDAQLGVVPPADFIPVAEDTGIVHDFLDLCLSEAYRTLSQVQIANFRIAINVSPKQLTAGNFSRRFLNSCARHNLKPADLELEFTESVFVADPGAVGVELSIIRAQGTVIALDDFGTGYSSLNLLRQLPIDILKIDRSFIQDIEHSTEAADLVRHVIEIAKILGKDVVAEGVESGGQVKLLREMGCRFTQGYFLAPALPSHEFLAFLKGHQQIVQKLAANGGQ